MVRRILAASAAFGLVLTGAPAMAQTAEKDLRCLILSEAFSKVEKDPAKRQIAAATGLFYFGRVDAQISGAALRNQFMAQKSVLQQKNAGETMTECAKEFISHQRALQAIVQGAAVVVPTKK